MREPALLRGVDGYERVMEGWVDNTHDDAFTHTVRLAEPGRSLELSVVATPPSRYEIRDARCRPLQGVDATVADGMATLAGTALTAGLTRRAAAAAGPGAGAALVVDAVVEVARLARQVAKLPVEQARRAAGRDPAVCWQLDTSGWADLPGSCFTYTDAGRARLADAGVSTPMTPELYSPPPGMARVFHRRKVARLERHGGHLRLFHSMHDNMHGFEITYEIDPATGRIVAADGVTSRLPYMGICTEPQRKISALLGEVVDEGLRKRIQGHLGGPDGCAQLYDLTADLLKLLAASG